MLGLKIELQNILVDHLSLGFGEKNIVEVALVFSSFMLYDDHLVKEMMMHTDVVVVFKNVVERHFANTHGGVINADVKEVVEEKKNSSSDEEEEEEEKEKEKDLNSDEDEGENGMETILDSNVDGNNLESNLDEEHDLVSDLQHPYLDEREDSEFGFKFEFW